MGTRTSYFTATLLVCLSWVVSGSAADSLSTAQTAIFATAQSRTLAAAQSQTPAPAQSGFGSDKTATGVGSTAQTTNLIAAQSRTYLNQNDVVQKILSQPMPVPAIGEQTLQNKSFFDISGRTTPSTAIPTADSGSPSTPSRADMFREFMKPQNYREWIQSKKFLQYGLPYHNFGRSNNINNTQNPNLKGLQSDSSAKSLEPPSSATNRAQASKNSVSQPKYSLPIPQWMQNRAQMMQNLNAQQQLYPANLPYATATIESASSTVARPTTEAGLPFAVRVASPTQPFPAPPWVRPAGMIKSGTPVKKEDASWSKIRSVKSLPAETSRKESTAAGNTATAPNSALTQAQSPMQELLSEGDAYFRRGRYDFAEKEYSMAGLHSPKMKSIQLRIALAQFAQARYSPAGDTLRKSLGEEENRTSAIIEVAEKIYPTPRDFRNQLLRLNWYVKKNPEEPTLYLYETLSDLVKGTDMEVNLSMNP